MINKFGDKVVWMKLGGVGANNTQVVVETAEVS